MVVDQGVRVITLKEAVSKLVDGSHNPPPKCVVGKPMLSARNIENGRIVFDSYRFIDEAAFAQEHARSRVAVNDVLLTIVGTIGRTAVVPEGLPPFALQRSVAVLTPRDNLLPKYLCYQLQAPAAQRYFEENARGTAQKGVYLKTLGATPIQMPSLDEQREVVDEIEKQFSRLDEAVANLQRVKANLKRYKASVLKAAVEGRLVETEASIAQREGRTYETGEQLLQRILEVRRERPKGKSKYKEPASPNLEAVTELPEGWAWASVEQVVAHLTDGDHQAPPQTDSGIPFLVIGNVRTGEIDLSNTRFVGEDYYNALDPYRQPTKGDLLYTLVGSYGIPVRVKTTERFCIQRHMAILRPHAQSPMDYLTIAMASDNVFKQATEVSTGTAQMTVPLGGLRSIAFGLPPKPELARIVAEVDRHLSIIREVETEVDANLRRAQVLRQAILSKQFSV
jgi:type I restriction enzyme S subunit